MNWLLKLAGFRDREYRSGDLSVRIEPMTREVVSVIYTRPEMRLNLEGELIGSKWEGIEVHIPQEVEAAQESRITNDLEAAFQAMGYRYVIARLAGVDVVPESERQAAITELRGMGYEIEVSTDQKQIRQNVIPGAPRPDLETARKQAPRITSLIQAVYGTRRRYEILASSKEFCT